MSGPSYLRKSAAMKAKYKDPRDIEGKACTLILGDRRVDGVIERYRATFDSYNISFGYNVEERNVQIIQYAVDHATSRVYITESWICKFEDKRLKPGQKDPLMHADVPAMQVMQRLRGLERLRVWGAVLALKGWNAIGERVSIYYPSERKWFMGVVSDFVAETWQHQIIFDDGDVEVCRLGIDRWARKPAAADIPLEGGEGREGALWFDQEFGTGRAPGEDLDTLKQVTGTFGAHAFAAGLQQAAATASLVPGASQANLEMWTKGLGLCKVRIVAWKRALGSSHGGWVNKPPDTFLVRVPYTDGTYNDMHLDLDKHVLYIPDTVMAFLRVDPRTVFSNMQQQERTRMDAMMPGIEDFPGMCALDALAASQHEARHNVELGMQLGASAPGVLPGFGAPQVPADAGPADDAARVAGVKREAPAAKHGFVAKALHAAEARDVAVAPAAKRPRPGAGELASNPLVGLAPDVPYEQVMEWVQQFLQHDQRVPPSVRDLVNVHLVIRDRQMREGMHKNNPEKFYGHPLVTARESGGGGLTDAELNDNAKVYQAIVAGDDALKTVWRFVQATINHIFRTRNVSGWTEGAPPDTAR